MDEQPAAWVARAKETSRDEVEGFASVFDEPIRPSNLVRFLDDDRHHLLLGYLDKRPAGFVTATEVFHPDKEPELFLNEIGVADEARRHGVGRALIEALTILGRERGCAAIWVLTDEDNEPAMQLYGHTGGRWDGRRQVMFEYDLSGDETAAG
jgi:ribosomal protein S18 acetylase RimI-like enzyme